MNNKRQEFASQLEARIHATMEVSAYLQAHSEQIQDPNPNLFGGVVTNMMSAWDHVAVEWSEVSANSFGFDSDTISNIAHERDITNMCWHKFVCTSNSLLTGEELGITSFELGETIYVCLDYQMHGWIVVGGIIHRTRRPVPHKRVPEALTGSLDTGPMEWYWEALASFCEHVCESPWLFGEGMKE